MQRWRCAAVLTLTGCLTGDQVFDDAAAVLGCPDTLITEVTFDDAGLPSIVSEAFDRGGFDRVDVTYEGCRVDDELRERDNLQFRCDCLFAGGNADWSWSDIADPGERLAPTIDDPPLIDGETYQVTVQHTGRGFGAADRALRCASVVNWVQGQPESWATLDRCEGVL